MAQNAPSWIANLRGGFIVFDGPDGGGKSTQFRRFASLVSAAGVGVCEVREPGGTEIGEQVRRVLLDPHNKEEIDLNCEMLLFMASRAQLVAQRIRPARAEGRLVLADRFISSTLAYQGTAGGLSRDDIVNAGKIALRDCWPDLVVIFDVDEATASARMNPLLRPQEFAADKDRIEARGDGFHKRVRQGYLEQARLDPQHHVVIDATPAPDEVFTRLVKAIGERFTTPR
ncbi:MAG: dTMP kinase [Planctomycetes bacterium]|nr:dTMP kinase [Planctomycetota bacterium]